MEIVFIRHTRVAVDKGTCYGQTDVGVADTFEQEAELTRRQLLPLQPFDAVFSSPLSRARLLATYCGYPDAALDDRLKEMSMGEWEMQRYDDITDPRLEAWYKDYMHLPTPGGESFPMLYRRVAGFLDELKAQQRLRRVAVFAHGGVLISAGLYAGLFPESDAWSHLTDYGGIERIEL